jgi:hypothetical protein
VKRIAVLFIGAVFLLLGLLWALQGSGLLIIKPILCFANCEPITGGSIQWLGIGIAVFTIGLIMTISSLKRRIAQKKN